MPTPANIIALWPSTNATIPTGWTRETTLDSKYPRGSAASVNPGGTGGQATHVHVVVDHTHTQNSHTHTFSAGAGSGSAVSDFGGTALAAVAHTHASKTSNAAMATNQNATITFDGTSNDPPYYTVIFIKSGGTDNVPVNALGFFNSASLPTSWNLCDGTSGRPDLRNCFPKGAAAAGNGGSTGGSSDAHVHTNTSHNHTQNVHSHSALASTNGASGSSLDPGAGSTNPPRTHNHSVSLNNQTATNNSTAITMANGDGQPPYQKLAIIQNNGTLGQTPHNWIGLWLGTLASIPSSWILCDGTSGTPDMRSTFLKGANTTGEIGNTGGALQHTHTANAHTHTQNAHNHASTPAGANLTKDGGTWITLDDTYATSGHTHTWTIGNTTATNQNTTVTINNSASGDSVPSYVDVAFVQYTGSTMTDSTFTYYHVPDSWLAIRS